MYAKTLAIQHPWNETNKRGATQVRYPYWDRVTNSIRFYHSLIYFFRYFFTGITCSMYKINLSTERLKWRPMLRQMRESMLRQTLLVRVTSDIHKIQTSDWPKLRCVLWRYIISAFCWSMGRHFQAFCGYVNSFCIKFSA